MTMKTCNFCKTEKTIESFAFNDKAKNKRRSYCRACQSLKNAEYHRKPKDVKPPPETKVCTKCLQPKPLDRFAFRKAGEPARRAQCTDCKNKYMAEYKRGARFKTDDMPEPTVERTNVVPPARLSIWERPVYVPKPWGR